MGAIFTNNATSLLSASIGASDTSLSITSGDESSFPSPGEGQWFPITVVDSSGNREIMKCTSRSGITLTIERAQEGTTARSFGAGARADVRLTAGSVTQISDELAKATIGLLSKDLSGGNISISAADAFNGIIDLTGTLTANTSVVLPDVSRTTWIRNSTTGAYSVTVKTSAGTGVAIPQGAAQAVMCDGTNVEAASPPVKSDGAQPDLDKLSFSEQTSAPASAANTGSVYTKDVSGTTELFYIDSGGQQVQITRDGLLNDGLEAGTKAVFYQASAPTGWTKSTAVNDRVLRVVSGNGGGTGGSWAITGLAASVNVAGHALTENEIPPHVHSVPNQGGGTANTTGGGSGTFNGTPVPLNTGSTGGGAPHNHGASASVSQDGNWRPAYIDVIVCERDAAA